MDKFYKATLNKLEPAINELEIEAVNKETN